MANSKRITSAELRGYLKAAEAKERLRQHRQKTDDHKAEELRKLIDFQATAIQAIRLERLTEPFNVPKTSPSKRLNKIQAERVAELMAEKRTWLPN